eukprot:6798074-Prymnesium_polylepis.1
MFCAAWRQRVLSDQRCRRCDIGTDSRPASGQSSDSRGCTLCAEHYYRLDTHLPAAECTPCTGLRGVHCGLNSTLETISIMRGFWRHSTAALEVLPCRSSNEGWTPCSGGQEAGFDGDGCALKSESNTDAATTATVLRHIAHTRSSERVHALSRCGRLRARLPWTAL